MKTCRKCGQRLDDYMFYRGSRICKDCTKIRYSHAISKDEILAREKKAEENKKISRIDRLMKLLKENGNVFINEMLDLEEIEKKVGFKVKVRDASDGEGGYIYERVK